MKLSRFFPILIPVVAVLLGLIAGALLMLGFGYSPIEGYVSLWKGMFGDWYVTGETVRQVTPLILTGLAVAFAFRAGLFNIGAEGQVFVGWLAAVWVGVGFDAPIYIHLPLAILAAALAGGLWGFVPGLLKATQGVHEVIVTIMMNYVALYSTNSIVRNVLSDNEDKTDTIPGTSSLRSDWMADLTMGSRMHYGILVALFVAAVMWFIIDRTTLGYEMRSVGFNKDASKYAGMNVKKGIILSMVISGAFAGLAGGMEGLGTFEYIGTQSGFTNLGFDGIAVALLGANSAIGVILAAILFGGLKIGALNMPIQTGIPEDLVDIIIALIIFFVASSYLIRWLLRRFAKEGDK